MQTFVALRKVFRHRESPSLATNSGRSDPSTTESTAGRAFGVQQWHSTLKAAATAQTVKNVNVGNGGIRSQGNSGFTQAPGVKSDVQGTVKYRHQISCPANEPVDNVTPFGHTESDEWAIKPSSPTNLPSGRSNSPMRTSPMSTSAPKNAVPTSEESRLSLSSPNQGRSYVKSQQRERSSSSSSGSILHVSPPLPPPLSEPVKTSARKGGPRALRKLPLPAKSATAVYPVDISANRRPHSGNSKSRNKQTDWSSSLNQRWRNSFGTNIFDETHFNSTKPLISGFTLIKIIGSGSFGRVYLARIKGSEPSAPVAIKRMTKSAIIEHKQIDHVLSEKAILARVDHPFLVKMHTTFQDKLYLYIVMEFIEGGEFFTYLRRSKKLSADASKFYAAHITLIFEYLHSLSIVYRDLKPENLLVTRQGYLKLTDFGFAKTVQTGTYTLCGTPEYIAPEVLLNKGHGRAVDWWSLGILIYEMIVGYPPFFDDDAMGIYEKILEGKVVFPRSFHRDAKSLVKKLLVHDISKRYGHVLEGVSDVREHRWFRDFDFEKLYNQTLEPPYKPKLKGNDDTSNFTFYEETDEEAKNSKEKSTRGKKDPIGVDPFLGW